MSHSKHLQDTCGKLETWWGLKEYGSGKRDREGIQVRIEGRLVGHTVGKNRRNTFGKIGRDVVSVIIHCRALILCVIVALIVIAGAPSVWREKMASPLTVASPPSRSKANRMTTLRNPLEEYNNITIPLSSFLIIRIPPWLEHWNRNSTLFIFCLAFCFGLGNTYIQSHSSSAVLWIMLFGLPCC